MVGWTCRETLVVYHPPAMAIPFSSTIVLWCMSPSVMAHVIHNGLSNCHSEWTRAGQEQNLVNVKLMNDLAEEVKATERERLHCKAVTLMANGSVLHHSPAVTFRNLSSTFSLTDFRRLPLWCGSRFCVITHVIAGPQKCCPRPTSTWVWLPR